MPKLFLLTLTLSVILVVAILTILTSSKVSNEPKKAEVDTAVNQAQFIFRQRKIAGEDFSQGPCLSNALMPDWVLDIAHNPRQSIDDSPQNQCPAFLEGRAKHFVELDTEGNLVRAR